jgi:hypothetical protein
MKILTNNPQTVAPELKHEPELRRYVKTLSRPRHYKHEPIANLRTFQFILDEFLRFGYRVTIVGEDRNIFAYPDRDGPYYMIGAHYDSVPETPGADDNASAVAAMLVTAKEFAGNDKGICFAAFNQEEDGLLGSEQLAHLSSTDERYEVHILEMLGFTAPKQRTPEELSQAGFNQEALPFPSTGDFIAFLSNGKTNQVSDKLLNLAEQQGLSAVGLQTEGDPALLPGVFHRSDHSPYWKYGFPAILWTDTAEYRSPHYHQKTDTPDTLDYEFLAQVTNTLISYFRGATRGPSPNIKRVAALREAIVATEKKLGNKKFVAAAPGAVFAKELERLEGLRQELRKEVDSANVVEVYSKDPA